MCAASNKNTSNRPTLVPGNLRSASPKPIKDPYSRMISLPASLESAIAQALRSIPSSQWISAAQRLSDHYRAPRPSNTELKTQNSKLKTAEALGYAALVLPAAYAQIAGALAATTPLLPPD